MHHSSRWSTQKPETFLLFAQHKTTWQRLGSHTNNTARTAQRGLSAQHADIYCAFTTHFTDKELCAIRKTELKREREKNKNDFECRKNNSIFLLIKNSMYHSRRNQRTATKARVFEIMTAHELPSSLFKYDANL